MAPGDTRGFRHEALLYAGEAQFVADVSAFVRDGLAHDEPTFVVVDRRKIELLREALAGDADQVVFADMGVVGRNPARIIPAWEEFVARRPSRDTPLRGVGEPISAERQGQELVECQRHEALLNLAFSHADAFWLLCPYDVTAVPAPVVDEACRSHPYVAEGGTSRSSDAYLGLEGLPAAIARPLPEPASEVHALPFESGPLGGVRRFVSDRAQQHGLGAARTADLVLAVNELASNSIEHGGGRGLLRMWRDGRRLVCEVRDRGRFLDLLADRRLPIDDQTHGRGLWIANQLCDLVQVRSAAGETIVRLHVAIP